ncbi:MAG: hypothetical protein CMN78_02455 [Spirochaetales bacterium]|nr:hypothetical protein [Spirochaetales bacterium]
MNVLLSSLIGYFDYINRISRRGTRFTNAYANCSTCIPARASLAMGRYVHEIGFWDNGQAYDGSSRSAHNIRADFVVFARSINLRILPFGAPRLAVLP